MAENTGCTVRNDQREDSLHAIRNCPAGIDIWIRLLPPIPGKILFTSPKGMASLEFNG